MDPFFLWVESSGLSVWTRESTSMLAFPGILVAHAIGMGLAAGINAMFALQILGIARGTALRELRRLVPIMWFGFWLNASSGILLLIAYPTKALTNPVFYLKLSLIAAGILIYTRIDGLVLRGTGHSDDREGRAGVSRTVRRLAMLSLVCWAGAITSGRLLAYTYTRLTANWH